MSVAFVGSSDEIAPTLGLGCADAAATPGTSASAARTHSTIHTRAIERRLSCRRRVIPECQAPSTHSRVPALDE